MPYDIEAMRRDGYTPKEIADALAAGGAVPEVAGMAGYDYNRMKEHGYTDQDIAAAIVTKNPSSVSPGNTGLGERAVKDFATGALGATVGLPGNSVEMVNNLLGMPDRGTMFPTTRDITKWVKDNAGINLKSSPPRDAADKFVGSASSLAGGMAALGPMNPGAVLRRAILGGAAGTAGAAADQVLPGSQPFVEMGGLLGMGFGGFRTPNANRALEPFMRELSSDDLANAAFTQNKTIGQLGTKALLTQGFDRPTALEKVVDAIAASTEGGDIRGALAKQLLAAQTKSKGLVDDLTPRATSNTEANRVAEVGSKAVSAPSEWRTARTAKAYKDAAQGPLPQGFTDTLISMLESRQGLKNMPDVSEGGRAFAQVNKKLGKLPDGSNPLEVSALAREEATKANAAFDNPAATGTAKTRAVAQADISKTIKDMLKTESPQFAEAERQFKQYSGPADQMRVSGMPEYFGKDASKGIGDFKVYGKILNEHPEQIRFIARNLEAADSTKQAFPQVVKAAWEEKWSKAFTSDTARTPEAAPGKFATSIAGVKGTKEREQFLTAMEEVGRAQGVDPKKYATSAEALMDALQVASRGRAGASGIDLRELERHAGSNFVSGLMRTPGVLVGASPASAALERIIGDRTFARISDAILDNENGVKKLVKILNYNKWQNAVKILARDLAAEISANENRTGDIVQ